MTGEDKGSSLGVTIGAFLLRGPIAADGRPLAWPDGYSPSLAELRGRVIDNERVPSSLPPSMPRLVKARIDPEEWGARLGIKEPLWLKPDEELQERARRYVIKAALLLLMAALKAGSVRLLGQREPLSIHGFGYVPVEPEFWSGTTWMQLSVLPTGQGEAHRWEHGPHIGPRGQMVLVFSDLRVVESDRVVEPAKMTAAAAQSAEERTAPSTDAAAAASIAAVPRRRGRDKTEAVGRALRALEDLIAAGEFLGPSGETGGNRDNLRGVSRRLKDRGHAIGYDALRNHYGRK